MQTVKAPSRCNKKFDLALHWLQISLLKDAGLNKLIIEEIQQPAYLSNIEIAISEVGEDCRSSVK